MTNNFDADSRQKGVGHLFGHTVVTVVTRTPASVGPVSIVRCRTFAVRASIGFLLIVCLVNPLSAQLFPVHTGTEVGFVLHVDEHPALGPAFVERARRRLERMLTTLLGYRAQVRQLEALPLRNWMTDHALAELTSDECRQFGLSAMEKTIVLRMTRSTSGYELASREYDRHFDTLDQRQHVRVVQRELVPDTLGRLALRCWTPVGKITGHSGGRFTIQFDQAARLSSVASWSRLAPGAVLQMFRDVQTAGGARQHARTDQFLVVSDVHDQQLEASLALPESGGASPWFQYIGYPQAQYLVRRLTPVSTEIAVKVVFRDTLLPREGCAVNLSSSLSINPDLVGHTGPGGLISVKSPESGLQFLTVQYEKQELQKVCLPGVTPSPLLFQIAPRSDSMGMDTQVAKLEDKLRDRIAVINDLVVKMNEASQLRDVTRMEQLMADAEQTSFAQLESEVQSLIAQVENSTSGIPERLQTLQDDVQQAQQKSGLEKFRQALRTGQEEVLKRKIAAAYQAARWSDAEQLLKQYVRLVPDDATASQRLAELSAGLPVQSQPHAAARRTIERLQGLTKVEEVISHWDELNDSLSLLLSLKDRLWLMLAEKQFNNWLTLINDDVNRIKQVADSGTALTQEQRDALADRARTLETLGPSLSRIVEQTDAILGGQ